MQKHKEPEYKIWAGIKAKCCPSENKQTKESVTGMCDKWRSSYEAFLKDVGRKPSVGCYLIRKDKLKGFFTDNVMWSVEKPGNNVVRYKITYKGETKGLSYWSKVTGISYFTLLYRKKTLWEDHRIIETPVSNSNKKERNYDRITSTISDYNIMNGE